MSSKLDKVVAQIAAKVQDLYNEYCLSDSDSDSKKSLNTCDLDGFANAHASSDGSYSSYDSDDSYNSSLDRLTVLVAGFADSLCLHNTIPSEVFVNKDNLGDISEVKDSNYKRGKNTHNEVPASQINKFYTYTRSNTHLEKLASDRSAASGDVFDGLESKNSLDTGGVASSYQGKVPKTIFTNFKPRYTSQIANKKSGTSIDMI